MHTLRESDIELWRVSDDSTLRILPSPGFDAAVRVVRPAAVEQNGCCPVIVGFGGFLIPRVGDGWQIDGAGGSAEVFEQVGLDTWRFCENLHLLVQRPHQFCCVGSHFWWCVGGLEFFFREAAGMGIASWSEFFIIEILIFWKSRF